MDGLTNNERTRHDEAVDLIPVLPCLRLINSLFPPVVPPPLEPEPANPRPASPLHPQHDHNHLNLSFPQLPILIPVQLPRRPSSTTIFSSGAAPCRASACQVPLFEPHSVSKFKLEFPPDCGWPPGDCFVATTSTSYTCNLQ